MKHTFEDCKM